MSAQSILTAMITPAVLISACGTSLLSTSHRIIRVIDRVHDWSARLELIAEAHLALVTTHREMIYLRQHGHRHLLTDPGDCPTGSAVGGRSRGIEGREGDRAAGEVGHVSNAGQVMGTPDVGH